MSFENGRQTDIQAIPAHMARGRLSSDIASIELDTIKVSLIYHFVRDEVILNSENKFLKVRWYCLGKNRLNIAYQPTQ